MTKTILLLDTISDTTVIGFFDGKKLHTKVLKKEKNYRLHSEIKKLILDTGYSIHDTDAIGVITGPGSFTGIRTGVTIANTLAYALDIPVYGVDALTAQIDPDSKERELSFLPANKDEVYMAEFESGEMVGEIEIVELEEETEATTVSPSNRIRNLLGLIQKGKLKPQKQTSPLYIKKPNITKSKK